MKPARTISLSILFSFLFITMLSADHLLGDTHPQTKRFILQSDNEQPAINDHSDLKTITQQHLIREMTKTFFANQSLDELKQYVTLKKLTLATAVKSMTDSLIIEKRFEDIITLSESLSQQQRLNTRIQFNYARALNAQKQLLAAEQEYQALLTFNPTHQAAAINLGLLLNKQEKYQAAQAILERAIDITSGTKKAKAFSALATSYQQTKNYTKAEKLFKKSIEYRPNHAATWLKLANMQAQLDLTDKDVIKTYKRAIALRSNYPTAYKKLGAYLLKTTNFKQAVVHLETALSQSNQDPEVHQLLAWAYLETNQLNDALAQWDWLTNQAKTKTQRLLASHIKMAIEQQEAPLKPLAKSSDKNYTLAIIAEMKNQPEIALKILAKIPETSEFYQRSQFRLKQLGNVHPS